MGQLNLQINVDNSLGRNIFEKRNYFPQRGKYCLALGLAHPHGVRIPYPLGL